MERGVCALGRISSRKELVLVSKAKECYDGHLPGHRNSCILKRHSNGIVLSQHYLHGARSWKADSGLGHLPGATLLP